jgi:transcription elongation GreA/GreB family factor
MKEDIKFNSDSEREEWFLAALAAEPQPVGQLLALLSSLHSSGQEELALSWAELLQDELHTRNDVEPIIRLLHLRETWHHNDPAFRSLCIETLSEALRTDGTGKQFVANSGFDKNIPTSTAIHRFAILTQLAPGILCYDKTWGAGVIERVDIFYSKVIVDFDKKRNHEMSLQYAAEALELLDDEHILAIHHRNPDKLTDMVTSDPAALARLAIRSYGPMNPVQLMEALQDTGMTEKDWKPFWGRARAGLKSDPSVDFPSSRSSPISLRATAKTYDETWLSNLEEQRAIQTITESLEDLATNGNNETLNSEFQDRIAGRVVFLMSGAEDHRPDLVARALVALNRLNVRSGRLDANDYAKRYLCRDMLFAATAKLPAKAITPFLQFLESIDETHLLPTLLLDNLKEMHLSFVGETMEFLSNIGREAESMQVLADHIARRNASPEMLSWLCQHWELMESALSTTVGALLALALDALEEPANKRHTKARRQLRQCFERKRWLADALGHMSPEEARDLTLRINCSIAWTPNEKAKVLARMLVINPELQAALETQAEDQSLADSAPRLTSWRSYNERVQQLEKIQREEIPQNAKALAHARSYGDLKENHAFKEAKEHQSILLRRRDALAQDLKHVRGSAFDEVPCNVVGPGTSVTLELADGSTLQYSILGEWDSDEGLGIISSGTRLAQSLSGHAKGSNVEIPSAEGPVPCRLVEVSSLPTHIQDWARG